MKLTHCACALQKTYLLSSASQFQPWVQEGAPLSSTDELNMHAPEITVEQHALVPEVAKRGQGRPGKVSVPAYKVKLSCRSRRFWMRIDI